MKKILFLCVANSARSQMAEGLAKNLLNKEFSIHSAGSKPSSVNPYAVKVMKEIGIDISNQKSKSVSDFNINDFDFVITLCAEEICPYVESKATLLHWPFPDPAENNLNDPEQSFKLFSKVRDEIKDKIKNYFISSKNN